MLFRARLSVLLLWCLYSLTGCRTGRPEPSAQHELQREADTPALAERAASYIAQRRARDAGDSWAQLYAALKDKRPGLLAAGPAVVVVADGDAAARATAPAAAAKAALIIQDLSTPAELPAPELLRLLAAATGYEQVVWVHGGAVWQLFADDPLRPFMGGLPAIIRTDDVLESLAAGVAMEHTLRLALRAAGAFQYIEAAELADRLGSQARSGPPLSESVLRARYALQLLGSAGLVLQSDQPAEPARPAFPQSRADTPYGDLLRMRLVDSKTQAAEWQRRRANILSAVAADRRDELSELMAPARACRSHRVPPMESVRDLVYGERLASALAPADAVPEAGQLTLAEWRRRYDTLLELTLATHSAWSYLPTLLRQRGMQDGASPAPGPTYARVSELALSHLQASAALQRSARSRYPLLTHLGLMYSAGVRADPAVLKALVELGEAALRDRLSAPASPESMIEGVLSGALNGIGYPDSARTSYWRGLHQAVSERLHGDLQQHTGWAVAGLYALDEMYRRVSGLPSELALDTHHFVRALGDPSVSFPELAALAQATALYTVLIVNNGLDPALIGEVTQFPTDRREAYQVARKALRILGASESTAGGAGQADDLAALTDGLFTLLSYSVHAPSTPAPTCSSEPTPPTPELRAMLDKLRALRARLLAPVPPAGNKTTALLRTRLLLQIFSDLMDYVGRGKPPTRFAIAADVAESNLRDGLQTWPLGNSAALLATGYQVLREALGRVGDNGLPLLGPAQTQALLHGLQAFATASRGSQSQLLSALSRVDWSKLQGESPSQLAAGLASGLYAEQKPYPAGIFLLTAALLETGEPTATLGVLKAAERQDRPLADTVRFILDTQAYKYGRAPSPSSYAAALREDADAMCQAGGMVQVLTLLEATSDFARGKRSRAQKSLQAWLRSAEESGLVVPRINYQFDERVGTLTLQAGYSVSYGSGVLGGSKDYKMGLGMSTAPVNDSKLTATFGPTTGEKPDEEAARYYVYGATLLAVYELLDGNTAEAERVAGLALTASQGNARLGGRPAPRTNADLAYDARGVMAVAAQLLAEAGLPVLAGRLWQRVYNTLGDNDNEASVLAMLKPLPLGLVGAAQLEPLLGRVQESLRQLARELPCRRRERTTPPAATVEVSCAAYPLALSLHLGGAGLPRPRLRSAATGCGYWPELDRLMQLRTGSGQPSQSAQASALASAATPMLAAGHAVEAALLLSPLPGCEAATLALARRIGGEAAVPPKLRQSALGEVISCTGAGTDKDGDRDLLTLDAVSRRLPGDGYHYPVLRALTLHAVRSGDWTALRELSTEPDFLRRFQPPHSNNSEHAAAALLLLYLVPASAGQPPPLQQTQGSYQLLCQTFPPAESAPTHRHLCADLKRWRTATADAAALRAQAAESLKALSGLPFP